nr:zinc finger, CCHC-type [Tanacetum cinerariifolium]
TIDYYTHYRRHPRIVAWSSKHKFYRHMLKPMSHDNYLLRDWYRMRLRLKHDGGFQVGHTLTGVGARKQETISVLIVKIQEQGNISLQSPKLTETNYTTWELMMETILKAYGLWKVIDETDGKKETSGKQKTAIDEKEENTTKGIIFQTLPQDMLMQVAQYTTIKEEWNSIKVKRIGANLVQKARLQTLRSELETLKMKPNESENEFAGKLSSIQAKFKSLGGTLKDKVLVRKLLNSVLKKFLQIVASIEQYQEIDTMQFEEAVGRSTAFKE